MNKQKWILLVLVLGLISTAGSGLGWIKKNQKLGKPGLKFTPYPGDAIRGHVDLPEKVLDYESEGREPDAITTNTLPRDTSYGTRDYKAKDGFEVSMNAVLMGTDRTSLHKPQFCLEGQGWRIDQSASSETKIPIEKPYAYQLPVVKLLCTHDVNENGQHGTVSGVYVYWHVTDGMTSASKLGLERMWWMSREMLRTGVLQRWAYVSCFSVCPPGREEATFERMKKFIAASVPEFQMTPPPPAGTTLAAQER